MFRSKFEKFKIIKILPKNIIDHDKWSDWNYKNKMPTSNVNIKPFNPNVSML